MATNNKNEQSRIWSDLLKDLLKASSLPSAKTIKDQLDSGIKVAVSMKTDPSMIQQLQKAANTIGKKLTDSTFDMLDGDFRRKLIKDIEKAQDKFHGRSLSSGSAFGLNAKKARDQQVEELGDEIEDRQRKLAVEIANPNSTMAKKIARFQRNKERANIKEFGKEVEKNFKLNEKTLSSQLLEVMEELETNPESEGLKALKADLQVGLRALKRGDYKELKSINKKLDAVEDTYDLSRDFSKRMEDIKDVVEFNQEKWARRLDKVQDFALGLADRVGGRHFNLGNAFRAVGMGVRGVKSVSRFTERNALRAGHGVSNGVSSALSGISTAVQHAVRFQQEGGFGIVPHLKNALGFNKDQSRVEEAKQEGFMKRQVRALEKIAKGGEDSDSGFLGKIGMLAGFLGTAIAGYMNGLPAKILAGVGNMIGPITSILSKVASKLGLSAVAVAADVAVQALGNNIVKNSEAGSGKRALGIGTKVLGHAATVAFLGGQLGSVVPGVGTAIGATVGGVLGAGYGLYENSGSIQDWWKDSGAKGSLNQNFAKGSSRWSYGKTPGQSFALGDTTRMMMGNAPGLSGGDTGFGSTGQFYTPNTIGSPMSTYSATPGPVLAQAAVRSGSSIPMPMQFQEPKVLSSIVAAGQSKTSTAKVGGGGVMSANQQLSLNSIPQFSYNDPSFFMLNIGAIQ